MSEIINLDSGVQEYFDFIIRGHTYRFTYPTMKQIKELDKSSKESDEDSTKKLLKFIKKVDKKSPKFSDVFESLTVPHIKAFKSMIEKEFGVL